jgi:DNA-binding NtrC family response regulator
MSRHDGGERLEKRRILVIDDDEVVRKNFKAILELEGYNVDTAMTGKEALDKSNVNFYDLALIDIRLPDMEGTQLLTTIHDTVPKMVKIIVTGYPSLENAKDAINMGADGYVVKPIMDTTEFLQKIKDHLKTQEEAQRYSEQKVAEYIESRVKQEETKEART